ncbi:hypothetical protein ACH5RR_029965 [Cinchona calisaya]|uniref:Uncharacterized protein n=1 Tax=Cinchona calisaya TaxID=153742 RepID=A0ABD2YWE3_9GENT
MNWRLHSKDHSTWAQALKKKYIIKESTASPSRIALKNWVGSQNKHTLKRGLKLFNEGSRKLVRNGLSFNLQHDNWICSGSLRSWIQGPLNYEKEKLVVIDIFVGPSDWEFSYISFELPQEIKKLIFATPRSFFSTEQDSMSWDSSLNSTFNCKDAITLQHLELLITILLIF